MLHHISTNPPQAPNKTKKKKQTKENQIAIILLLDKRKQLEASINYQYL